MHPDVSVPNRPGKSIAAVALKADVAEGVREEWFVGVLCKQAFQVRPDNLVAIQNDSQIGGFGTDLDFIPLPGLKSISCRRDKLIDSAIAAGAVVTRLRFVATKRHFHRVHIRAIYTNGRQQGRAMLTTVGSQVDAGIRGSVEEILQLQNEVSVRAFGPQDG